MRTLYEDVLAKSPDSRLSEATVIRGDNVAQYVHESKDSFIGVGDIPNAAPPFFNFWVEETCDFPAIPSAVEGVTLFGQSGRATTAQWFTAYPIAGPGAGWKMVCLLFQRGQGGGAQYMGGFKFIVNADGTLNTDNKGAVLEYVPPSGIELDVHATAVTLAGSVWMGLLVVSFMHCQNVELVEHGPHKLPAGARNRRGPKVKYYTLEIDAMKKVLRTEGQSETTGLKKALHICRGHFAHYTADKPLFGKYTGTFWRPMHTRGSAEQGEVIKDYKINPPEPPQP